MLEIQFANMVISFLLTVLLCFIILLFSAKFQNIFKNVSFKILNRGKSNMKKEFDKIWTNDKDYIKFYVFFEEIRKDLTFKEEPIFDNVTQRINEVLLYNMYEGKKIRAMLFVKFFKLLNVGKENYKDWEIASYACGWMIEMIHSSGIVLDDIMDDSITRRGKLCWYRYKNQGMLAINDGLFLQKLQYIIGKKYCSKHPCYLDFIDLTFELINLTTFGQIMDCYTCEEGKRPNYSLFTRKRYASIVKYKTSLYTFVLPTRGALFFANIKDKKIHSEVSAIMLKVGHLFQAQDDYLDVYGDPNVTGKVGTDIEDGKCTWIAVEAYQLMNEKEKIIFEENYGRKDAKNVEIVKTLFEKMNIKRAFKEFEENEMREIQLSIEKFTRELNIQSPISNTLLQMIYKRNK